MEVDDWKPSKKLKKVEAKQKRKETDITKHKFMTELTIRRRNMEEGKHVETEKAESE